MKDSVEELLRHQRKFYSREGEDGLLAYVLRKLPSRTGWCVEFGAWDGKSESNTHYLISEMGYHGIMIEADPSKFKSLCENMKRYDTICINAFVRSQGPSSLDCILRQTPIPKDFDLLSIDVDGEDYQVWKHLANYEPKVVIVEINTRDKPGVMRVHNQASQVLKGKSGTSSLSTMGTYGYTGTSISAMTEMASKKGYSLLANVHCNAVYVKREFLHLFYEREVAPEEVFLYVEHGIRELSLKEMRHLGWRRILEKCFCS